jgi:hypothetical protein
MAGGLARRLTSGKSARGRMDPERGVGLSVPAPRSRRAPAPRPHCGERASSPSSDGQSHPVIGLWSVALREELRHAQVGEDVRRVERWTARYRLATVTWPTEPFDPFFNANTTDDIAAAERDRGWFASFGKHSPYPPFGCVDAAYGMIAKKIAGCAKLSAKQ